MIERICTYCQKPYQTYPAFRLKYCSSACTGADRKRGVFVPCAQCGKDFYKRPSQPAATFCSKSCKTTASNLTAANPSYSRDISGERNPMYGKGMNGADNPMYGRRKELAPQWKGGRKVRKDGYVLVVAPDDHPYPADQHKASGLKYVLEHRLIMERHLGRYLQPGEVVHHRDINPNNNDLSNLQLFACQADHISIGHSGKANPH